MGPPPDNGDFATLWSTILALSEQLATPQAQLQVVLSELYDAHEGLDGAQVEIKTISGNVSRATTYGL